MANPPIQLQASGTKAWRIARRWKTLTSRAPASGAEQRRAIMGRPLLSVSVSHVTDHFGLIEQAMLDSADSSPDALLWPDMQVLTASATATDTQVMLDTSYRRLAVGQGVLIAVPPHRPGMVTLEQRTISAVLSDRLTLTAGLTNGYAAHSWVIPLIECVPQLRISGRWPRSGRAEADWTMDQAVGDLQVEPVVTPGVLPSGYNTHGGLPILGGWWSTSSNAQAAGVQREGELQDLGLGVVPQLIGDRASRTVSLPMGFKSRAEAWGFLGFFDSRAGACYPFWLMDYAAEWELLSIDSSTTLSIRAAGRDGLWGPSAQRPYLAMLLTDGSELVIPVTSATRTGDIDQLTLTNALPGGLDVDGVSFTCQARHGRFLEDELLEIWYGLEKMATSVSFIETLQDQDVDNSVSPVATTALSTSFSPGSCGIQAAVCTDDLPQYYRVTFNVKIYDSSDVLTSECNEDCYVVDAEDACPNRYWETSTSLCDDATILWDVAEENWRCGYGAGADPEFTGLKSSSGSNPIGTYSDVDVVADSGDRYVVTNIQVHDAGDYSP